MSRDSLSVIPVLTYSFQWASSLFIVVSLEVVA